MSTAAELHEHQGVEHVGFRRFRIACSCGRYVIAGTTAATVRRWEDHAAGIDNAEFASFVTRVIKAFASRAGSDVDMLPILADMSRTLDTLLRRAVAAAREPTANGQPGYTWTEIAQRLGVSKQAAQQRFGPRSAPVAARRQGVIDAELPFATEG